LKKRILKVTNILQEFSIPLMAGVIAGLVAANLDEKMYYHIVHWKIFGANAEIFHHKVDLHFLVNDVFMVFFFGIAAKEITESVLPGGALNPMRKAINPLLGTIGGVVGPVGVYFALTAVVYGGTKVFPIVSNGWGIPTATDIALAWLAARLIFGAGHPAINFLLLLAVADDAIGLGIIAIFYPDPKHPVQPIYLFITAGGMGVAYALRRFNVRSWVPYIAFGGLLSWVGLLKSSLHPALALVFVVPFLPGPRRDVGLFEEAVEETEESAKKRPLLQEESFDDDDDEEESKAVVVQKKKKKKKRGKKKVFDHKPKAKTAQEPALSAAEAAMAYADEKGTHAHAHGHDSPLEAFEHQLKLFVDFGLFFFAFANAGVAFSSINAVTWIVLASLILGKTIGIALFSMGGVWLGFPLPTGMRFKHLVVAGVIAGLGLTVALFVSGQAFPMSKPGYGAFQGPAKMGAVLSAAAALIAFALGRILHVKDGGKG
jgi:Na+/H+ antiporter NhaA